MTEDEQRPSDKLSRRLRWMLLALVLAGAIGIRLIALGGERLGPQPDTHAFLRQTRSLLDGRLADWFYHDRKPPLFAAAVAGPAALGLSLPDACMLVAFGCGLWMLHPAWLLFRRFGDDRTALAALALIAVIPMTVTLSARMISDTFYAVIFLYMTWLLLTALADRRPARLLGAGLLLGLGFLTRSEALTMLPITAVLLLLAALARRLSWKQAGVGMIVFVLVGSIFIAPYVALVSYEEGSFTLRRNAGHFLKYSAGLEQEATDEQGRGEPLLEAAGRNLPAILGTWARNIGPYIYDETSQAVGYVPMLALLIGLAALGRRLLRFGPWQMGLLIYLMSVLQLALFEPHARLLCGPICLLVWVMAAGAVWTADLVVAWNPAGLARPARVTGWIVALLVAMPLAPTISYIAGEQNPNPRKELREEDFIFPPPATTQPSNADIQ